MYQKNFSQAKPDFQLNMGSYSGDSVKIDEFVRANSADVQILRGVACLTDSQLQSIHASGKFVVGVGDQLVKIPVREIGSATECESMNSAYNVGTLLQIAYMTIPEAKRGEFVDALDSMNRADHNVQRARFVVLELGRVSDEEIARGANVDDVCYQDKILAQAEGHFGALQVLGELLAEGPEVFDRVAPQLGQGPDVWLKYEDECGEDIRKLIATYAK